MLSTKQKSAYDNDSRHLWCVGAVRSGKTHIGSLRTTKRGLRFPEREHAFIGRTLQTLQRNVIGPLQKELRNNGIRSTRQAGSPDKPPALLVEGVTFWLFSASTKEQADKIQGSNLDQIYGDEFLRWPLDVFRMAMTRLMYDESSFTGSCNPEHPGHRIKTDYIDRMGDYYHFVMDDNPILTEQVKAHYRSTFTGHAYRRFILGEWCGADGLIYPYWKYSDLILTGNPDFISYDYGPKGVTCAHAYKQYQDTIIVTGEYWHDGYKQGRLTAEEHVPRIIDKLGKPPVLFGDPSANELRNAFRRKGYNARNANNDLEIGIRVTNQCLVSERFQIARNQCPELVADIDNLIWDEESVKDKPDEDCRDHGTDSLRYGCVGYTRNGAR